MTKKKLTLLLALAGAGIAIASSARAHSATVVIQMTPEGFEPREVTVDTESIVNFVNKDTVERWPASNVHPTHDVYPEFDPQRPIPPGDFWIFRPKKTGEFKYHDHLIPHRRGTITITPEENPVTWSSPAAAPAADLPTENPPASLLSHWQAKVTATIARAHELIRQFFRRPSAARSQTTLEAMSAASFVELAEAEQHQYLTTLKEAEGLTASWEYVKKAYTDNTGAAVGNRAHDLAHFTGELIFKDNGLSGLSLCDATFAFGCYHGFTEAAFARSLDPLQEVARACETVGALGSGPWASCIHGIGHGVATFFDAVELDNALATCDHLAAGATYCHDGVFMEFSFSAPPSFYSRADPLVPCTTVAEQYQLACARNQPSVMQQRLTMSQSEIAAICASASPTIADSCIDAIGFAIANESRGNAEIIITRCRVIQSPPLQARCVSAAAGEIVFQNFPNWQTGSAAACDSLTQNFRAACYQRVQTTAQDYQRN